jgi:beta-glucosidase-like glycosyl hydrolase
MCGANSDIQQAIVTALNTAAGDGTLTLERIDQSVKRILLKKLSLGSWDIESALAAQAAAQN